ncbi:hypothetical protein U1872_12450 [Sphingomonas sp. RB3P16]|uniref:hypothetical protein n=1 Tax=Parasphingomonas frigoris TaxID=3096163 RepID=UPI002FCB3E93
MKNAFVLQHHHGDDGSVSERMILMDMSEKRFSELEKRDLVREATAKEVRDGYQPDFARDTSGDDQGAPSLLDLAVAAARDEAADLAKAEIDRLVASHDAALADQFRELSDRAADFVARLKEAHDAALEQARDRASKAETALAASQKEIERLTSDAQKQLPQGDEKKAPEPGNKKAADPANKGA